MYKNKVIKYKSVLSNNHYKYSGIYFFISFILINNKTLKWHEKSYKNSDVVELTVSQ